VSNAFVTRRTALLLAFLPLLSCSEQQQAPPDLVSDPFPEAQAELRAAVESIAMDAMTGNVEGLQAVHLQSDKFTKFGPRRFERQDVATTNEEEADYFTSINNLKYEVKDLKIDVFGDIGVVTYYPHVSFVKEAVQKEGSGRQTLVFLKTPDGWKIVHEHGTPKF